MGIPIPVTPGAVDPLTLKSFQTSKLALDCEGGDQHGIFTAGVLNADQQANFNPFQPLPDTSAGAQNLPAYVCTQPGYARQVITHYTASKRFYDPLHFMRGGDLIDPDWWVAIIQQALPLVPGTAEKCLPADVISTYATAAATMTVHTILPRSAATGMISSEPAARFPASTVPAWIWRASAIL